MIRLKFDEQELFYKQLEKAKEVGPTKFVMDNIFFEIISNQQYSPHEFIPHNVYSVFVKKRGLVYFVRFVCPLYDKSLKDIESKFVFENKDIAAVAVRIFPLEYESEVIDWKNLLVL